MSERLFDLRSKFKPTGDQPEAVAALYEGLKRGDDRLILQGVTGSGKTFTMANLIAKWNRPTLILSHNKTLAAQLFSELKEFFPNNAVEYFISYYDYYQPEAYIPQTDTYIEKDAAINEEIERYRLAATNALIGRRDVIIVSSVSCIYGLGESDEYRDLAVKIQVSGGEDAPAPITRSALIAKLVEAQYVRNDMSFEPGVFRVRGDIVDIFPAYETKAIRVEFFGEEVDSIRALDPVTGKCGVSMPAAVITPAKQFVMGKDKFAAAFDRIEAELKDRLAYFASKNKLLEAQRLRERTEYDIEMMRELGYCNGIENYSRPLTGRAPGSPGECLLDYFPDDFLTIIDESHVSVPQIRAMYNGDQARKNMLVEYGFRLPSAKDNRPLTFEEFNRKVHQIVYCSATPGDYEYSQAKTVAEQVIRPTGLLDPEIELRPLANQIDDLIAEIRKVCGGEGAPAPKLRAGDALTGGGGAPAPKLRAGDALTGGGGALAPKLRAGDALTGGGGALAPKLRAEDALTGGGGALAPAGDRVLVTTLTKRSSEDLTAYLRETGIRVEYLHSDIDAIERVAILQRLRKGEFDVLVGINLLREGLDLPEVALVAILDADKEGFLRSTTSLVQTAGRTARHERGRVILYCDHKTDAIRDLLRITKAHRERQIAYNTAHHIVPHSVKRAITESTYLFKAGRSTGEATSSSLQNKDGLNSFRSDGDVASPADLIFRSDGDVVSPTDLIAELTRDMLEAADHLEFERAAYLRDQIKEMKKLANSRIGESSNDSSKPDKPSILRKKGGSRHDSSIRPFANSPIRQFSNSPIPPHRPAAGGKRRGGRGKAKA